MFSCDFGEISKNTFSSRIPLVAAFAFSDLLEKDVSFSVDHINIQIVSIELCNAKYNISGNAFTSLASGVHLKVIHT